jgi:predicted NUDIX family NTP pyrophosphohydrolase
MTANAKRSAGLLMYRRAGQGALEVFLAHPGGPYFAKKDAGAWTIPKGEPAAGEDLRACALREFEEETGLRPKALLFLDLGSVRQRAGKVVQAWAFEGDWQGRELRSNTFEVEWPPRSGRRQAFPEIDRVEFFSIEAARSKINPAQVEFLERLCTLLAETA